MSRADWVSLLYVVGFALFIVGLRMVRGPRTAVRGNLIAAGGMGVALVATLLDERIGDWVLIVIGVAIGTAIGIPAARSVKMTAMPQLVSLFNAVGGGAAAVRLAARGAPRLLRGAGAHPAGAGVPLSAAGAGDGDARGGALPLAPRARRPPRRGAAVGAVAAPPRRTRGRGRALRMSRQAMATLAA